MPHPANDAVPRRASRLGSLASPALLWVMWVVSALTLGTVSVTCESPRTPPPDAGVEDAGPTDASGVERDAGQDAHDAYDGPAVGDPCTDSRECGPPQMICCANICREPHLCL